MKDVVVGISDLKVSNNEEECLVTYALGSCIAVAIYDPMVKVGGLLHYMLPDSILDSEKARKHPEMFADTGIPLLFRSCYRVGAEKKRMIVRIAGGARIMDDTNYFRIGQKNITALRKIFWKNGVLIDGEDVGENFNRTVRLEISTGRFSVKGLGGAMKELK
jgi:chemotaxis protein CheD